MVERRTRAHQRPIPKRKGAAPEDLTGCERCGDVFRNKTWRRSGRRVTHALLARSVWGVCPACRKVEAGEYFGRVVLRGGYVAAHEEEIRRRIHNVTEWARYTQPERRIVAIRRPPGGLEVLTTSQKLAHRIVHELKKAFKGRASYSWSDRERRLFAVWEREEEGPSQESP
jgi:NMD protein affecting ribosome stability and mRNA decay